MSRNECIYYRVHEIKADKFYKEIWGILAYGTPADLVDTTLIFLEW